MAKIKTDSKYFEAVGRRKTSVARVRLFLDKDSSILVNNKKMGDYFPGGELQNIVNEPLKNTKIEKIFNANVIELYGSKKL